VEEGTAERDVVLNLLTLDALDALRTLVEVDERVVELPVARETEVTELDRAQLVETEPVGVGSDVELTVGVPVHELAVVGIRVVPSLVGLDEAMTLLLVLLVLAEDMLGICVDVKVQVIGLVIDDGGAIVFVTKPVVQMDVGAPVMVIFRPSSKGSYTVSWGKKWRNTTGWISIETVGGAGQSSHPIAICPRATIGKRETMVDPFIM